MSQPQTKSQISAGGVVFRHNLSRIEVALISVGDENRWQLPKGIVGKGESPESTAMREAREETGIETDFICPIDKVEYWYYSNERGERIRFHKFVYFYLLRYKAGDVRDHDHEVNEARWIEINEASEMLTFKSEKKIVEQSRKILASMHS